MKRSSWLYLLLVILAIVVATISVFWSSREGELPEEMENLLKLRDMPANVWVKYVEGGTEGWWRQSHAGLAYHQGRGTLIIFGSDTHNLNWDNSVHEFHPLSRQWETHYATAPQDTYRADAKGRAIAGGERTLPWAMHTYDSVIYDPQEDGVVIASRPEHNPIGKSVTGVSEHPVWIYDAGGRSWRAMENNGNPTPRFFGGSLVYDESRDVIVAYHGGIWELGPKRDQWRQVSTQPHHEMHFSLAYDSWRQQLFVFGDYNPTNVVWSYTPGDSAGAAGSWQRHAPKNDVCPPFDSVPVAFDRDAGVFLLVVDDKTAPKEHRKAYAFIFDPDSDKYYRLPEADLPALGMNYMMVWDRKLRVFFLVTGSWDTPLTVWALRLNRALL